MDTMDVGESAEAFLACGDHGELESKAPSSRGEARRESSRARLRELTTTHASWVLYGEYMVHTWYAQDEVFHYRMQ